MNDGKITIAMAIYKPNLEWLHEQLQSLNALAYQNLRLLVWNDCPEDSVDYESLFAQDIVRFPFIIRHGERNLGSTLAFAVLTEQTETEYIAYCDQDDVWLPQKLNILMEQMTAQHADMACSDMYVVDAAGELLADSITTDHPAIRYVEGKGQLAHLLHSNFVTGCTVLMKTELAQRALPFPACMCHDWWLAITAASSGPICIVRQPLIRYRTHGGNQTGFYNDVQSREAYYENRILNRIRVLETFRDRLPGKVPKQEIEREMQFCLVRKSFFERRTPANAWQLARWAAFDGKTTAKTFAMALLPEGMLPKLAKRLCGR